MHLPLNRSTNKFIYERYNVKTFYF